MYLEYCPYGDLGNLLAHHQTINQPIPEPLIWQVFESLVSAGLIMERRIVTQPNAGWTEIVHRDFKPQNAFLGLHPQPVAGRDNWAAYPAVKLGDYGLAVETSPTDARNPVTFVDASTPRYYAPEQVDQGGNPRLLTDKTNVFGVGITVMALMDYLNPIGVHNGWAASHASLLPHLSAQAVSTYSRELVALVSSCVAYNQNTRPSFAHLRASILRYTRGEGGLPQDDRAQGMRASTVKKKKKKKGNLMRRRTRIKEMKDSMTMLDRNRLSILDERILYHRCNNRSCQCSLHGRI
jgi:serine/threonine protein kinase